MPSIFSQIENSGCSVQREDLACNDELKLWLHSALAGNGQPQTWGGVVQAKCDDLRQIEVDDSMKRALAVYDTAEKNNPSHAEIFQTQYVIDAADAGEIRSKIFKAFGGGPVIKPSHYRENFLERL